MILRLRPSRLRGRIEVPPSRSLLHRELICRCLAGQSTVLPPHAARDVVATARGLEQLTAARPVIDCGDSECALRLLVPVFMALGRTGAVFTGTERLLALPDPADMGLEAVSGGLRLTRPLQGGTWRLPAAGNSRVVTGLLLALPLLPEDSAIELTGEAADSACLRMTAAVMDRHGVTAEITERGCRIPGGQMYRPGPELEEPDWSAAAFWEVLSAVQKRRGRGRLRVPMGHPPYLQGDAAIMELMERLPPEVDVSDTPDLLLPLLLYAALQPETTTRFACAALPGTKERDRLAAAVGLLRTMGAAIEEQTCGLTVTGSDTLHGCAADTDGDDRIAMLAGCAAMLADSPTTLRGAEAVARAYPAFWRDMETAGGRWEILEA